jgi:hypothetical protein
MDEGQWYDQRRCPKPEKSFMSMPILFYSLKSVRNSPQDAIYLLNCMEGFTLKGDVSLYIQEGHDSFKLQSLVTQGFKGVVVQ